MEKLPVNRLIKPTFSDRVFDIINLVIMVILLFVFVWPLWFVLIASFSDPNEVWMGNVLLWPKGFNLMAYEELFTYGRIWTGYGNTIFYTVVGTIVNLIMTICAAYPLSKRNFMARHFFIVILMITMYFGGGLIPTYLVVNKLGLLNTRWAMIIPGACSVYNVLITRTYFMNSIPDALQEVATLDGANSYQYLVRIVLPLSKPILAVIGLYYAVGHWNDFYTALIYITNEDLLPLQSFLRDILMSNKMMLNSTSLQGMDAATAEARMQLAQTLKYSVIIVSTVPVLCVYPFIQKYFVKGVMLGSLKG